MNNPLEATFKLRPRYDEVDQMGYVYHANYVSYCHQARTELLRKLHIDDQTLDKRNILLPVIRMNLRYLKPAGYDELLTIKTRIINLPATRFSFQFEIRNEQNALLCTADSTVVFVDKTSRRPMKAPQLIIDALEQYFKPTKHEIQHTH
nr:acyl-CoA thioesterase [Sunxiuqinia sp.]